ncbi:MAG TPA: hypothetical protein VGC30_03705 [Dokdonella sp.]
MTARRAATAAAALAALLIAAATLRPRHAPTPTPTPRSATAIASPPAAHRRAWPLPPAPDAAAISVDPQQSARTWQRRAHRVVAAKRARRFGAEIGRLLERAPNDAWAALRDRAEDGDGASAVAATLLAQECAALVAWPASARSAQSGYADRLGASALPPDWIAFLRSVDALAQDELNARIASCAGVGDTTGLLRLALARLLVPDDPLAQLADATTGEEPIDVLRDRAARSGSDADRLALGERLLASADATERQQGLALVEPLAGADADAAGFLARCFAQGCPFRYGDADPAAAAAWLERAAGLGFGPALERRIAELDAAGRTGDAWAWSLYRLDLALAGCFEFGRPTILALGGAAEAAFAFERRLSAPERARGTALAREIAATWTAAALAGTACAG